MPDQGPDPTALRQDLLRWYRAHRRDLPWRRERPDPYHVLVSEAMLQQTQVATVIAYFQRFVAALPSLDDLASADEQQVLRLWQGLGYYRRARQLHAAAKAIVTDHAGQIPSDPETLASLPGIGPYTAGAIASIAFGVRAPILDGNVARVLARWHALDEPIDATPARKRLWSLAERAVPIQAPGDFNQALMELGALICTPAEPQCLVCPVRDHCRAHRRGLERDLPRRLPRRTARPVEHHVLALARRGRLLFVQRPARGMWSNMWQLPTWEQPEQPEPSDLRRWAGQELGLTIADPAPVGAFGHQTTHKAIRFVLWRAAVTAGRKRRGTWRSPHAVDDLPLAVPQQKALALLAEPTPAPMASSEGGGRRR